MKQIIKDEKYRFVSAFDSETGFYIRTGILDESVLMEVRTKGGICRARGTKGSKSTNYVVVTGTLEGSSALSFIHDALLLQSEGFPVKAVFAADLMKALESADPEWYVPQLRQKTAI